MAMTERAFVRFGGMTGAVTTRARIHVTASKGGVVLATGAIERGSYVLDCVDVAVVIHAYGTVGGFQVPILGQFGLVILCFHQGQKHVGTGPLPIDIVARIPLD